MRSDRRWPAVAAALRRPNESAVGALRTGPSGNRVMLRGGSQDNWGQRELPRGPSVLRRLRLMEGRDCAAVWVSASSPPSVTMKSRSSKRTCAPGAQLIAWVAIRGLIWNAQAPTWHANCRCFVQAPASKFIVMRVRLGWCAKGHKIYTGSGGTSLRPVCCCLCY